MCPWKNLQNSRTPSPGIRSKHDSRPTVARGLLRFVSSPTCCARAKTFVVHVIRSRRKISRNSRANKHTNRTVRGLTLTFSYIRSNGYLRANCFGFFHPVSSRVIAVRTINVPEYVWKFDRLPICYGLCDLGRFLNRSRPYICAIKSI